MTMMHDACPKPIREYSKTRRSLDQLWNHYQVEKMLADQVRSSSRADRLELLPRLYGELFRLVPDHPRLQRRENEDSSKRSITTGMSLLSSCLNDRTVFLEIAPGDCRLASAVAQKVSKAYGADISDQRAAGFVSPSNFELLVFDGFELPLEANSVDVAFSYQFLEHLHPDDVGAHMQLIERCLRPGGIYVLDTPHAFSGPHDISRYFSDTPDGFHMHEWTYRELAELSRRHGFDRMSVYRFGRRWDTPLALWVTLCVEQLLTMMPRKIRWSLSQRIFAGVTVCLRKRSK